MHQEAHSTGDCMKRFEQHSGFLMCLGHRRKCMLSLPFYLHLTQNPDYTHVWVICVCWFLEMTKTMTLDMLWVSYWKAGEIALPMRCLLYRCEELSLHLSIIKRLNKNGRCSGTCLQCQDRESGDRQIPGGSLASQPMNWPVRELVSREKEKHKNMLDISKE